MTSFTSTHFKLKKLFEFNPHLTTNVNLITPKEGSTPSTVIFICGSTPRYTLPDLQVYSPRVLPVYDFKRFGSTPRGVGVLPQIWYSTSRNTPRPIKIIHWECS